MATNVEKTIKGFGRSLAVANVQELASKNLKEVPLRYIRPEVESDEICVDESDQVPVIDMSKLVEGQLGFDDELQNLHLACKEWGFFQLVNHGVEGEVIEKMKKDIQEFFRLPLQEKMTYAQLPDSVEGYGQAFVLSENQKLDWADMFALVSQPVSSRNLKFWPTTPSSFRENFDKYLSDLQSVTLSLLRMISRNLGLGPEKLESKFVGGSQVVRMTYYPPCVEANKVIGMSPHSDASGLSLLAQVGEVTGLQFKKNGKWVPIKPLPGAFVVNIGDVLEIMSNGEYKSIEHRAVINPEKERIAIATFHGPSHQAKIGPLHDLDKANYKTILYEDFLKLFTYSKLDGKSLLDHVKLGDP